MQIKSLSEILKGKVTGLLSLCLLLSMNVLPTHSESYMLAVGESVTISQTPYGGGYIDNVGLGDYLDSHLEFIENADNSATIKVKSYFDYTATVKLVFIERYVYMGKTQQSTYYRDIDIKCKFVAPTSVSLPKAINVSTTGQVDITPTVEPDGASITSMSWTKDNGSAVFSIVPTDNKCTITGKTAGEGTITVTINGNERLKATSNVVVYDPSNPPPSSVSLPKTKEISIGGHVTLIPTLSPSNAATTFMWTSSNEDVATVSYGKVVGKAEGTTTITVWTANYLTATCTVTVVRSNGKDDEGAGNSYSGTVDGYGYVDLGLSVKWATCNVGANNPEDFGGYYAWGDITESVSYSRATYYVSTSINTDIKGTKYDVAYMRWGQNWRMPTRAEFDELFSKCTCKEETLNGVSGYRLTGSNGASIFIPKAGYKEDGKTYSNLRLWTSTPRVTDDTRLKAWQAFYSNYSMQTNNNGNRYAGYSVRPVTTAEGTPNEVTDITVIPSYKTIDVGESFYVDYELTPSGVSTTVTWSSDNTSVATVSSTGLVKGIGKGSTYIKAVTSNGISDYCYVTVNSPTTPEPTGITVSPSSKTINVNETFYASYTLTPSNAETSVTWYSDDSSIATVSSSGLVKGIKAGTTYINAKTSNGKEDWCKVTVNSSTPQEPTGITVSPSSKTIGVGETFYVSYTLSPSNAETTVTWYSDNTSIATVSSSGLVKGIKAGTTYINAKTSNGKEDWCKVTVTYAPVIASQLVITSRSGSKTILPFDSNPVLTFDGEYLVVSSTLANYSFPMGDIVDYRFDDTTGIIDKSLPPVLSNGHVIITGLQNNSFAHVFSLGGEKVMSQQANSDGVVDININSLPKGVYVVSTQTNKIKVINK